MFIPLLHNTFPERSIGTRAKKMSGFFKVPKQCSLNFPVERSKEILREPSAGTFREHSQGTFQENFAGNFLGMLLELFAIAFRGHSQEKFLKNFLGMFLEIFAIAFRELSS